MAGEQHRRERMSRKKRLMTSTLSFKSLCVYTLGPFDVSEKVVFFLQSFSATDGRVEEFRRTVLSEKVEREQFCVLALFHLVII